MVELSSCPECGAEYPTYTSPAGQLGMLCAGCGYTSEDYLPPGRPGRQPTVAELEARIEEWLARGQAAQNAVDSLIEADQKRARAADEAVRRGHRE